MLQMFTFFTQRKLIINRQLTRNKRRSKTQQQRFQHFCRHLKNVSLKTTAALTLKIIISSFFRQNGCTLLQVQVTLVQMFGPGMQSAGVMLYHGTD